MKQSKPNWGILGALRFILSMIVVCNHLILIAPATDLPTALRTIRLMDGFTAVFCFLAVSGFSIAASIDKDETGFYQRRFQRLGPVYYACMLFSLIPIALTQNRIVDISGHFMGIEGSSSWIAILSAVAGLNFFVVPVWGSFGPTWTLTCEIVYYSIAPFFHRYKWLAPAALVGSLIIYLLSPQIMWFKLTTLSIAPLLAWFWLAGWVLYRYRTSMLAHAVFGALLACTYMLHTNDALRLAPITLLTTWIAFTASNVTRFSGVALKAGSWLGDVSYPMYLSHVSVMLLVLAFLPQLRVHPYVLLVLIVAAAASIQHWIEVPLLKFIRTKSVAVSTTEMSPARITENNAGSLSCPQRAPQIRSSRV